jgi:hypothetical protein
VLSSSGVSATKPPIASAARAKPNLRLQNQGALDFPAHPTAPTRSAIVLAAINLANVVYFGPITNTGCASPRGIFPWGSSLAFSEKMSLYLPSSP